MTIKRSGKWLLEISFPTEDPSPPEMQAFYDSLSKTANDHWFYQEYGVAGANKGFRQIGFEDLTSLQVKHISSRAKKFLPKVKVKKRRWIGD